MHHLQAVTKENVSGIPCPIGEVFWLCRRNSSGGLMAAVLLSDKLQTRVSAEPGFKSKAHAI